MLAFIHTPKTAGTTVIWMLRSTFGLRHCDVPRKIPHPLSPADLRRVCRLHPKLRSIAGHRITPYAGLEEVCPDLQYFTFLRNPLKRCASQFQHAKREGIEISFEELLSDSGNGQTKQLADKCEVDAAIQMIHDKDIFVGLVEHFDMSIVLLRAFVTEDLNIAYRRKNVAADSTIAQDLLSAKDTRRALIEANKADLELYSYVKEELYTSYRREYGSSLERDVIEYQQNRGRLNRSNVILNRLYRNLVYKPIIKLWYRLY